MQNLQISVTYNAAVCLTKTLRHTGVFEIQFIFNAIRAQQRRVDFSVTFSSENLHDVFLLFRIALTLAVNVVINTSQRKRIYDRDAYNIPLTALISIIDFYSYVYCHNEIITILYIII